MTSVQTSNQPIGHHWLVREPMIKPNYYLILKHELADYLTDLSV